MSKELTLSDGLRTAFRLLPVSSQRVAGILVVMMLVNGFVEVSGVAGIMPFVSLASDPQAIEKSAWMSKIYSQLKFSSPHSFLIFLGVAFILLFSTVNLCRAVTTWLGLRFSFHVSHRLAVRLLQSYLGRSYMWLRGRNSTELGKDVLHEIEALVRNVYLPMTEICTNGLAVVMIAATLLFLDPWVAIGTGGTLVALFSLIYQVNRGQLARNGVEREKLNSLRFRAVHEGLYALKEARLLTRREQFLQRYSGLSNRYNKALAVGDMVYELPHYLTEVVAVAGLIGSLMYFALRPEGQAMAWLMLYVMATWRMLPSLQNMYRNLARIRFYLPSLSRLAMEMEQPLTSSENVTPLPLGEGIKLDNIHFTYPSANEETLHGLTLEIPRGSRIALVGQTGSGKTTVADMVAGLLEPGQGSLWVNGQALDADQRNAWQRNVGYVPQEIFLSDDTVSANIGLGISSLYLDQAAVEKAAQAAQIHDFISELPQGYASILGERGASMSGGQRQRIGIARALYHQPELLIFDEATSALDEVTQRKVLESLEGVGHQLTVLVIAHRLEVVRNCDKICLLEGGHLVASGTYAELLENCPQFSAFVRGHGAD